MIALCGLLTVPAFAGDIYTLRLTSKTPVIKQAASYYKDFTTVTYNGFINIEYNIDGTIISPSEAILYGTFADGRTVREMTVDLNVSNVYGKNYNKAEVNADCNLDGIMLTLAGIGKCKIKTVEECDACGNIVNCTSPIKLDNITGNFTGLVMDVLCDPCNDNPWTFIFNNCATRLVIAGVIDVMYGSWNMRYNKKLSAECDTVGFPECVMSKIPKAYLPAE